MLENIIVECYNDFNKYKGRRCMDNRLNHLGIIMDGNRRWAKQNKKVSTLLGHEEGTKRFGDLLKWCMKENIPYLTVYAFSTENFNRSKEEVDGLFKLFEKFFKAHIDECIEEGIKILFIGDRTLLSDNSKKVIIETEKRSAHCDKLVVQIALAYGGRDEIVRSVRKIVEDVKKSRIDINDINEELFSNYLDTTGIPDVDLIIRTGGNRRLSNFLPWQSTYSEIIFTNTLWPDFSYEELKESILYYRDIQINKGK